LPSLSLSLWERVGERDALQTNFATMMTLTAVIRFYGRHGRVQPDALDKLEIHASDLATRPKTAREKSWVGLEFFPA